MTNWCIKSNENPIQPNKETEDDMLFITLLIEANEG